MGLFSLFADVARIRANSDAERHAAEAFRAAALGALGRIGDSLDAVVRFLTEPDKPVVGISVSPGQPVPRSKESIPMANVKLVKKSKLAGAAPPKKAKAGDPPLVNFQMQDNQDDTCTVSGVDAAGAAVDISGVASLSVASGNPAVLTVDSPVGMTFTMHGVAPGTADVTVTATWNDGSTGPFTFVLPTTESGSPATGITVTPGVPTVRP